MKRRLRARDSEILALAGPALATLATDPLISLVDTAFVGRLGAVALAALAVASALFGMVFWIFNALAYGTTPLVSHALGRGDRSQASEVVMQALTSAAVLGVVSLLLLVTLAEALVGIMGAQGPVLEGSVAYLRIRALAAPAALLVLVGHGAFRGYQDTRTPLVVTLGLNAVNLVLDPILIFGLGWGLQGAAIATVIAQWLGAVWFLSLILVTRRRRLGIKVRLPAVHRFGRFVRAGSQLVLRTLALLGVFTLATAVAARLGTVQVAAHQIVAQLFLFLALTVDSLAIAGQALVGRYLGAGDRKGAHAVSGRLLQFGLVVGFVLAALLMGLRGMIPSWFTTDGTVQAGVESLIVFLALMQPLTAAVFVWDGVFIGAAEFRFLAVTTGIAALGASVLMLTLPRTHLGLAGVWWSIVALMIVRFVFLAVRYQGGFRPAGMLSR